MEYVLDSVQLLLQSRRVLSIPFPSWLQPAEFYPSSHCTFSLVHIFLNVITLPPQHITKVQHVVGSVRIYPGWTDNADFKILKLSSNLESFCKLKLNFILVRKLGKIRTVVMM